MRQINLVRVHRENLLFGVVALDLNGQQRFLRFSAKAAVGAIQKETAGELHGQRAGAFVNAPPQRVAPGRFHHARQIHAPMLEKVLILGGSDRVLQHRRNLFPGEQNAALQGERSDLLPVVGIQFGDNVRR